MIEFLDKVDPEITSVLGQHWNQLKKQNERFVCVHTLLVLWQAMTHSLYKEMDWADQNIIKWVALLHDIRKLSTPAIQGKDHVHPFKSAAGILEIMRGLKIIDIPEDSEQGEYFN